MARPALDFVTRLRRDFAHAAKGGAVKTFGGDWFGVGERLPSRPHGAWSLPRNDRRPDFRDVRLLRKGQACGLCRLPDGGGPGH